MGKWHFVMLIEVPEGFLKMLLHHFVSGGHECARSDVEIEAHLRDYLGDHNVSDPNKFVDWAFEEVRNLNHTKELKS